MEVSGGQGEVALVASCERFGPSISIGLDEAADSTFRWSIVVGVVTSEADYVLGRVLTVPPAAPILQTGPNDPVPAPLKQTRIVAICYCPGVTHWKLSLTAEQTDPEGKPADTARCQVTIGAQHWPGSRPGVFRTDPDGTAALDMQVTASISTAQIVVPINPATQLLPDDPDRRRAEIKNTGQFGLYIGDENVTAANGFLLAPGERFITDSQRPLYAISAGPNPTSAAIFIHHG